MPFRLLFQGDAIDIIQWTPSERELRAEFFNCPNVTDIDAKKITHSLLRVSTNGLPSNKEKYRHVIDKVFELKPTSQLRLFGFRYSNAFVIINCVRKKKDKLSSEDKRNAQFLYGECFKELGDDNGK